MEVCRPAVMLQVECAERASDCGGTTQSEPRAPTSSAAGGFITVEIELICINWALGDSKSAARLRAAEGQSYLMAIAINGASHHPVAKLDNGTGGLYVFAGASHSVWRANDVASHYDRFKLKSSERLLQTPSL